MGIYDRDYMKERPKGNQLTEFLYLWRFRLLALVVLTAMTSLIMWAASMSRKPRAKVKTAPSSSKQVQLPVQVLPTNSAPAKLVNVNTAPVEELDNLPYISPRVAQAIIDGRPYKTVDDLLRVPGIGKKTLEYIRAHIQVE